MIELVFKVLETVAPHFLGAVVHVDPGQTVSDLGTEFTPLVDALLYPQVPVVKKSTSKAGVTEPSAALPL